VNRKGTPANLVAAHAGNANAASAGVYSRRLLEPRGREIADALQAAPQATPLDQIAAEEIGSLVALVEAIDDEIARKGLTNRKGDARSLLDLRIRASGRLERWLREFGATPAARVEWAGSLGRTEAMASALRDELAHGRALREAATQERDVTDAPTESGCADV
jgi:hypothetical protein